MVVLAYTDASYNPHINVAACGFCVLANGKMIKHEVTLVEGLGNSTEAEIFSVVLALQYAFLVKSVDSIFINTDCKTIVDMKNKKTLALELYETLEIIKEHKIGVTIQHVRAHGTNRMNNKVDRSCNKSLKQFIIENGKEKQSRWNRRRSERWNKTDHWR